MGIQQAGLGKQIKIILISVRGLLGGYPFITLGVGFFLGVVIGLVVLGWGLWPVKYTDARIIDLSANAKADTAYQQNFFRLAADAYQFGRPIGDIALWLGDGWGADSKTAKENVLAALDGMLKDKNVHLVQGEDSEIQALRSALADPKITIGPPAPPPAPPSPILPLLGLAVVAIVAVVLLSQILKRLRASRSTPRAEPGQLSGIGPAAGASVAPVAPAPPPNFAKGAAKPVAATAWAGETQPPLAQYVTQYALGDDRYDMSFSIEQGNGDFLGECGVGISETIGVGSPDKVTALEVWLFDKNDIRTLTKVLMSEHCFNDPALRAKLAPKGEAAMVRKGEVVTLTTQTLKVQARVIDLQYGSGNLPTNSFFQIAKIELAAWKVGA
jgi:hypothetical protein